MKIDGWLIDVDYITKNDRAVIRLWCKNEDGIFVVYDNSFRPYFYAFVEEGINEKDILELKVEKKGEVISPESVEIVKAKYLGKDVELFKIYAKHPQHVPKLREALSSIGLEVREADIPFAYRYLIDKNLACMDGISVEGCKTIVKGRIPEFKAKKVERVEIDDFPNLKVLAFDCEMLTQIGMPDPEKDPIIVISVKCGDFEEIIHLNGMNEKNVIARFLHLIRELDPDVIVGYNQDAFDWPYIKKRAEKYNLKLEIGRDLSNLTFRPGNPRRPKIAGRLNIDLYDIALRSIDVKIKKLESVAEYLGTKVEIADIEAKDIYKKWISGDKESVLKYARQDVLNTYYIAEELLPMQYELSKMIRIPPDDVARIGRGKQVEWLLMSEAFRYGEIAPNPKEVEESYEGAFVLNPVRGLHENVICLDFASMYPSIMVAFNISPDTLTKNCSEEECFIAPEVKHAFKKKPDGFFRRILKMLIEKRKKVKKIMKKLDRNSREYKLLDIKQATLKVLTNSFYGYTGWSLARWYCRECAEATTAWGRHFIKTSVSIAKNEGFEVLYGDTDSIFVKKDELDLKDLEIAVKKLTGILRKSMPIQIEIDEYYKVIFFVEKKRYAGLTADGRIIVKGLEVRRGDWCELAKEVQKKVIEIILKERKPDKAVEFVRKTISEIKSGKYPLEYYVIYKSLTKKPSKYESMQAHVKAAMKAAKKGIVYTVGSKVGYIVIKGAGNVSDRAFPVDLIESFDGEKIVDKDGNVYKLDKEYYIDKQVVPVVMRILERFGFSESELKDKGQKTLDAFF